MALCCSWAASSTQRSNPSAKSRPIGAALARVLAAPRRRRSRYDMAPDLGICSHSFCGDATAIPQLIRSICPVIGHYRSPLQLPWLALFIPSGMQRPLATSHALRRLPLDGARWALAARVECVPRTSTTAVPAVMAAWLPCTERAANAPSARAGASRRVRFRISLQKLPNTF